MELYNALVKEYKELSSLILESDIAAAEARYGTDDDEQVIEHAHERHSARLKELLELIAKEIQHYQL